MDLNDGFFHVPIEETSVKYTVFVTPDGQYEFLRVPFGLCNSPTVFQRFVRTVFKSLIDKGVVLTYLNDLIIHASTEAESYEKLKDVINTAKEYGLIVNWKKCKFMVQRVEYLGSIIEDSLVQPSNEKTKAV